jgi:hypothetical protein
MKALMHRSQIMKEKSKRKIIGKIQEGVLIMKEVLSIQWIWV